MLDEQVGERRLVRPVATLGSGLEGPTLEAPDAETGIVTTASD
jgi:hypothetical protein